MISRSKFRSRAPFEVAKDWIHKHEDPPGFYIEQISQKGRGVKASKTFQKGDFLLHYTGEVISGEEGDRREGIKSTGFRFFFKTKEKQLCIDATEETGRLGRLVNHGEKREINCQMKQVNGTLCLFASRDIQEGEELLYSYGVHDLPWKKKKAEVRRMGISEYVPRIVVIKKDGTDGPVFYLETTYCLLGKSKNCDIIVSCPGVKQVHCQLEICQHKGFTSDQQLRSFMDEHNFMLLKQVYLTNYESAKPFPYALKHKDVFKIKNRHFRIEYPRPVLSHEVEKKLEKKQELDIIHEIEMAQTEQMGGENHEGENKLEEDRSINKKYLKEAEKSISIQEDTGLGKENMEEDIESGEEHMEEEDTEPGNEVMEEDTEPRNKINEEEDTEPRNKINVEEDTEPRNKINVEEDTEPRNKINVEEDTEPRNKINEEEDTEPGNEVMEEEDTEPGNEVMEEKDTEPGNKINEEDIELGIEIMDEEDNDDEDMDEEWLPHSESEDSDCDDINVPLDSECEIEKVRNHTSEEDNDVEDMDEEWLPHSESEDSDCDDINLPLDSECEIEKVRNHTSDVTSDSHLSSVVPDMSSKPHILMQLSVNCERKKLAKFHCCYYCEKMYMRISRHYEQVHSKEMDVAKVLSLPKKSKNRKAMWAKLVNKGNYHHNYKVLEKKQGVIIPKYRPRIHEEKEYVQYVPCEFCLGSYVGTDLWKHQKTCNGKVASNKENHIERKTTCIENGKMLLPAVGSNQQFYENILVKMRNDTISHYVQTDQLILSLGARLYEKNGQHVHQHQYIAQRLRELARLLIQMKENNPTLKLSLTTCILPCNWNILIDAVKAVAGYNEKTHTYSIPSLPLKLGHSLSKCAKLVKSAAIMNNDEAGKQNADNFLELYKCEWTERVSSQALTTLHDAKFNTPKYLPIAEDVKLLHDYLHSKGMFLKQKIKDDLDHYNTFAEVCLAQLILFNRKRSGETERIQMQNFEEGILGNDIPRDADVVNSLTEFEKELCKSHWRIEIKGKRGRKVPVLFTAEIKSNIEVLLEARKKLNLQSNYIFIKQNNQYPIRGCDCLRRFANECGAKSPELLTSTRLRKHLATMTQVLGLTEGNQDMIAQFMGHDIRVHRQFYRLPENMLELAKVSKVLHLINSGTISSFKGKDFDEIEFTQTEEIEEEEKDDDDDPSLMSNDEDEDTLPKSYAVTRKQKKTRSWSIGEKAAVMRHLKQFITDQRLPGKRHCEQTKKAEPILAGRPWDQIKHFIRNQITAANRIKFNVKM